MATILAHEMGHVCARHGVRALETYLITQGLTDLIFQRFNPARNAEPQPGGAGEQSLRIPARGAPVAAPAPFAATART